LYIKQADTRPIWYGRPQDQGTLDYVHTGVWGMMKTTSFGGQ